MLNVMSLKALDVIRCLTIGSRMFPRVSSSLHSYTEGSLRHSAKDKFEYRKGGVEFPVLMSACCEIRRRTELREVSDGCQLT